MGRDGKGFSAAELRDLKTLVAAVFTGGKIQKRFQPLMAKWGHPIRVFLLAVNRENGTLGIDPLEACVYPCMTFAIMSFLQEEFIQALRKSIADATEKSKRRK